MTSRRRGCSPRSPARRTHLHPARRRRRPLAARYAAPRGWRGGGGSPTTPSDTTERRVVICSLVGKTETDLVLLRLFPPYGATHRDGTKPTDVAPRIGRSGHSPIWT